MKVEPHKGQAAVFFGRALDHGVEKVSAGTRYTVPIWFIDDVTKAEL